MSPPLHLIFADGDRDMRNIMRGHFAELGFPTFLAANVSEAVGFAARTQARLVLLNYDLSPSSGLEACERIRELPGYSVVPILLMAHPDVPRLRQKAQRAGVSALVPRPFSVLTLLREVEPFLLDPDRPATGPLRDDRTEVSGTTPPGFSETAMVWQTGPALQTKYASGSLLTQGKLALEVHRRTPAPPVEPRKPVRPRRR